MLQTKKPDWQAITASTACLHSGSSAGAAFTKQFGKHTATAAAKSDDFAGDSGGGHLNNCTATGGFRIAIFRPIDIPACDYCEPVRATATNSEPKYK